MAYVTSLRTQLTLVLLIAAALASGCASAPVQEMSNARQAIRAAENAGAATAAPAELEEAKALLVRAEEHLERRDFKAARMEAKEARNRALQALRTAKEQRREPE